MLIALDLVGLLHHPLHPEVLSLPARFVHNDRLDASQVRAAWPAASDGFEPASGAEALLRAGRGFALPYVTLGVGAGRSRNPGQRAFPANATAKNVTPAHDGLIKGAAQRCGRPIQPPA